MTPIRAWARSADMHETNAATGAEAEAIREWIARYEPRLLSPLQRSRLLPKLRELVLAAEFPTLNHARTAMSRSVRFIADTASPEAADLGELLNEINVAAWSHGRPGRPAPSPQEVSSVRRLLRLHHGLSPRCEPAAPSNRTRPVFTSGELEVLDRVADGSDADLRMLIAVVGAGAWGSETDGAQIDVADGVPWVVLASGGRRPVDPAVLEALPRVPAGPVTMAGWHNLTRRASRAGVKLTQYRARDAWAARMLSEPRPAAEVIKDLGIRRETIAAVAPLLDLPAPEEMRKMLRGQPRGDWRDARDGHGHPQSATSDADLEVN